MGTAPDPYCYPGTSVLINHEGIKDAGELRHFEVSMTAQRMREGVPQVEISAKGYAAVHRFIFQDVYPWAGTIRTVEMSKDGPPFCRPALIEKNLARRFDLVRSEGFLKQVWPGYFAERAAEHLSELNAIHPFREGNGRTMRAFLKVWGDQAGHKIELQRINPEAWNEASRHSFYTADTRPIRRVIETAIVGRTQEQDRGRSAKEQNDREHER